MKVFLIRHGQKVSKTGDPGLTRLGTQQAEETATFLQQFQITKIIASPSNRARQTAVPLCRLVGLPMVIDDRLVERMEWDPELIPEELFLSEWIRATADRHYQPIVGDSSFKTGERMQQAIIDHQVTDGGLAVVSHGGAIVDFLRTVLGDTSILSIAHQYPVGWDHQTWNCGVTVISYRPQPTLEMLNSVLHLTQITE